jgi:hypothetical protein
VYFGDDEILVDGEGHLKVVGVGGTLRDNSAGLGGLLTDVVEKVGGYECVGAVA